MRWIITKDHITQKGERKQVGVGYVAKLPEDAEKLPFQFRLYDDDGELYYEGRSDNRDSEAAFQPLDWAMADSGCTRIDYLQDNGEWKTL